MGCLQDRQDSQYTQGDNHIILTHPTVPQFENAISLQDLNSIQDEFASIRNKQVSEDYTIGKWLGQGIQGDVYSATSWNQIQKRAIKVVEKRSISQVQIQKYVVREAAILKIFDHPNIIKLFDVYEDDQKYHMIIEWLEGGDLYQFMHRQRIIREETAAYFTRQILNGLVYCHSRGIVHRDLKPENLLLDEVSESATIKLIDFGTAGINDGKQKIASLYGTPYYTAPEIVRGWYCDKSDMWSLGCVIYAMLSGRPPFSGNTDKQIYKKVKSGKYKFDGQLWMDTSREAKDLIERLLVRDPQKRLSAQEALLHPWLNKSQIGSSDSTPEQANGFDMMPKVELDFTLKKAMMPGSA